MILSVSSRPHTSPGCCQNYLSPRQICLYFTRLVAPMSPRTIFGALRAYRIRMATLITARAQRIGVAALVAARAHSIGMAASTTARVVLAASRAFRVRVFLRMTHRAAVKSQTTALVNSTAA